MGVVRGLLAAATFLAFVAMVIRIWDRKYQAEFDQVARLAISDEASASADSTEDK